MAFRLRLATLADVKRRIRLEFAQFALVRLKASQTCGAAMCLPPGRPGAWATIRASSARRFGGDRGPSWPVHLRMGQDKQRLDFAHHIDQLIQHLQPRLKWVVLLIQEAHFGSERFGRFHRLGLAALAHGSHRNARFGGVNFVGLATLARQADHNRAITKPGVHGDGASGTPHGIGGMRTDSTQ